MSKPENVSTPVNPKKIAAEKAVEFVSAGMTVGLGTGSTAYWAIQSIGEKVRQGLKIKAIPSSLPTEKLATELGIPLTTFADISHIDLSIDGADEIDPQKNLIKGGGGALMREKIIAYSSRQFIVIADESKLVNTLGKFPLPLEVLPFGAEVTLSEISRLCNKVSIRKTDGRIVLSDNGNCIIDCHFHSIPDPELLDLQLKKIPGVLETGIFIKSKVTKAVIGYHTGEVRVF